ncbi:Growth_factor receptor cysteine-rich domain superfamily [Hexamita inflata]|uniref:Growth factor receptor cysteine-rich domain superfamily n=1 Tax=Hexamita inflata TaxID=28002 RepID=A0AA86TYA3_9EUKA|nr:Growth factor receptor cysteine-rich domain superfamily [Hexamita inflata]
MQTNGVPNIFQGCDLAQISEPPLEDCAVCGDRYYTYGLCLQSLTNGIIQSTSLVCQNSFVFDGQDCVCSEGKVLNGSACFDILNIMSKIVEQNNILGFQVGTKIQNYSVKGTAAKELQRFQEQQYNPARQLLPTFIICNTMCLECIYLKYFNFRIIININIMISKIFYFMYFNQYLNMRQILKVELEVATVYGFFSIRQLKILLPQYHLAVVLQTVRIINI